MDDDGIEEIICVEQQPDENYRRSPRRNVWVSLEKEVYHLEPPTNSDNDGVEKNSTIDMESKRVPFFKQCKISDCLKVTILIAFLIIVIIYFVYMKIIGIR